MIEDFRGLKIKGRCFENEARLEFFKNEKDRLALIFGRNGSGKTTVTKALEQFGSRRSKDKSADDLSCEIIGAALTEELSRIIAVFNENYILHKFDVRDGSNGIGAIPMFGDQPELHRKITVAIKERDRLEAIFAQYLKDVRPSMLEKGQEFEQLAKGVVELLSSTGWKRRYKEIHSDIGERPVRVDALQSLLGSPTTVNVQELREKFQRLRSSLKRTEEGSTARENILKKLYRYNNTLTRQELGDRFKAKYPKLAEAISTYKSVCQAYSDWVNKNEEILALKFSYQSIKIAAKRINKALASMFLSEDRLQLDPVGDTYRILSDGHAVQAGDISIGERNALALAYFFSDFLADKSTSDAQESEWLIVLDDPISSFDHENKIGVLSYILSEIEEMKSSRFICLTHDMYTFMTLATAVKSHDRIVADPIGYSCHQLDCRKQKFDKLDKLEELSEYVLNFQDVFDFACENEPQGNRHAGNQMRRILEGFSTFVYREGVGYLFLAGLIKGENSDYYNKYFHTRFTRIVIQDESHTQLRIRSLTDVNNLFEFFYLEDKQRAIRESICLLYLLNPDHVLAMYKANDKKEFLKTKIEEWLKDIRHDNTIKE